MPVHHQPGPASSAPVVRPLKAMPREPVLGVPLAAIDYDGTLAWIDAAVAARQRGVHLRRRGAHRDGVPGGSRAAPPPSGARLHGAGRPAARLGAATPSGSGSPDRVYGPELMDRACARAARTGQRVYLYGGRNHGALAELARAAAAPASGPADRRRPLPAVPPAHGRRGGGRRGRDQPLRRGRRLGRDRRAEAGEVDGADARPPRRRRCSSASARRSTSMPAWSRRRPTRSSGSGSSGLFRLVQEPRRLWRRYLRYNPRFVAGFVRQYARHLRGRWT